MFRAAVFLIWATLPGFAQAPNDWRIVPGVRIGPITPTTTRADLTRLFGEANVKDAPIYVGEGFEEPGTMVFGYDPSRTLEVLWSDKGPGRVVQSVYICGKQRRPCRWRTPEGISMGTDLKTLEKYNLRPFRILGIEADFRGTVTSWEGGSLAAARGRMLLRFDLSKSPPLGNAVTEDGDVLSSHPVMHQLNPVIYEFIIEF